MVNFDKEIDEIIQEKMINLGTISLNEIEAVTPIWTDELRKSIKVKGTKSFTKGFEVIWDVPKSKIPVYEFVDEKFHNAFDGVGPIPEPVSNATELVNPAKRVNGKIPPRQFRQKTLEILTSNFKKI
jgi:hypothetical protein